MKYKPAFQVKYISKCLILKRWLTMRRRFQSEALEIELKQTHENHRDEEVGSKNVRSLGTLWNLECYKLSYQDINIETC